MIDQLREAVDSEEITPELERKLMLMFADFIYGGEELPLSRAGVQRYWLAERDSAIVSEYAYLKGLYPNLSNKEIALQIAEYPPEQAIAAADVLRSELTDKVIYRVVLAAVKGVCD